MEDVRKKLIEAAGPIFAAKGFAGATVREICKAAGVNLAGVNYYFGDKQQLYLETVKTAHRTRAEQVPMAAWPDTAEPSDKLRGFITTIMRRLVGLERAPWQVRLMMREVLQPTDACEQLVEDYIRPHLERLMGILDEILPDETPLHRRRQIAFSIIGQCLFYRLTGGVVSLIVPADELGNHYGVDQLAEQISQFTLSALGLRNALGAQRATSIESRTGVARGADLLGDRRNW
jgi:AcrR family transcriptional regulator